MKKNLRILWSLCALAVAAVLIFPAAPTGAQGRSGDQQMARTRFVRDGVTALGAGVLQTGEVNTLSAAVATTTLTQVVAAPGAGNATYLRGLMIEKMTTGTGSVLVRRGTGTNCGTGTATIFEISLATGQVGPIGYVPVGVLLPANEALCLVTDAATTSVRALTN